MVPFRDRTDAGRQLAERLSGYASQNPLVLALPRGGVPVAFEVAQSLKAPLDVILVRKIGAPGQSELALGAVVDGERPFLTINEEVKRLTGASNSFIEEAKRQQLKEIERRREYYLKGRPPLPVQGHTAIVVDDGIATGASMRVALKAVKAANPKRLVMAVPVAPMGTIEDMRALADDIVCLDTPHPFGAVGLFYANFGQTSDEEVSELLQRSEQRSEH